MYVLIQRDEAYEKQFCQFHISSLVENIVYKKYVMCSTEIQIELVIDNESRDLQLSDDSFLILIGLAKAGLRDFKICLYENSKQLV